MGFCISRSRAGEELFLKADFPVPGDREDVGGAIDSIAECGEIKSSLKNRLADETDVTSCTDRVHLSLDCSSRWVYHRQMGRELFLSQEYDKAIHEYTKAIELSDQKDALQFYNRALCYKTLGMWNQAIADCKKAIEIKPNNFKYYYAIAVCLHDRSQGNLPVDLLREVIGYLDTAMLLCKRRRHQSEEAKRMSSFRRNMKKKFYSLEQKESGERLANAKSYVQGLFAKESNKDALLTEFESLITSEKDKDIPDYLTCKISYDLVKDPYLTSDGITYDLQYLSHHFARSGYVDPISKRNLDSNRMVPNLTIQEITNDFIERNPWAYDEQSAPVSIM